MINQERNLTNSITQAIKHWVAELQKKYPNQTFRSNVNESNRYWSIHWESKKYLEEYFQLEIWRDETGYSIMGEHRMQAVLEEISEEHFIYEGLTLSDLLTRSDKIIEEYRQGVLYALNADN